MKTSVYLALIGAVSADSDPVNPKYSCKWRGVGCTPDICEGHETDEPI
jgi:hypothetical protein